MFKTNHQYKLTAVSVTVRGRTLSRFVQAPMINGKAVVDGEIVMEMARELGCDQRGSTFSVG